MGSVHMITLLQRLLRKPFNFVFCVIVIFFCGIRVYHQNSSYVAFPIYCNNASCHKILSAEAGMGMPISEDGMDHNYLVNSPGCKIMDMNPFDASVKPFIDKGQPTKCAQRITKLDKQKITIDERMLKTWKTNKNQKVRCCYRTFDRVQQSSDNYDEDADWKIKYEKTCHHIPTDNGNPRITVNDSFIKIECRNYGKISPAVEFQGIALPPKVHSKTTRKKAEYWDKKRKDFLTPPSILIVGVDTTSRNHMIRSLPKTRKFLQQHDFIEMKGYNKVGENTFPNIMAGFGGMEQDNYTACWQNDSIKFDNCPFIWKNFSDLNYITGFLEDSPGMAIFNFFKVGFVKPPTDYYMRPLTAAIHQYNGWDRYSEEASCVGGASATEYQVNYIKDCVQNMGKSYPYFLFSWFTSIGHRDFNGLKTADDTFLDSYSVTMNKTNANPDNTVIIFMSDHGYRYGSFRKTFLGFYEESLPFFFLRLPPSLKNKYPEWYSNLKRNSGQLTSPFDLHSTLTHILNDAKSKVENASVNNFKNFTSKSDRLTSNISIYSKPSSPKFQARYSFFEYIPDNRSCESSSIPQRYCMCGVTPEVSQPSNLSSHLGGTVIAQINNMLYSNIYSGICAKLNFKHFLYGREIGHGKVWNSSIQFVKYTDYLVALEAGPSGAEFESKLRTLENSTAYILGDITRINSYNGQSDCISDFRLKPFCYCKKG